MNKLSFKLVTYSKTHIPKTPLRRRIVDVFWATLPQYLPIDVDGPCTEKTGKAVAKLVGESWILNRTPQRVTRSRVFYLSFSLLSLPVYLTHVFRPCNVETSSFILLYGTHF